MLRILLLGKLELRHGEQPVELPVSRKTRALLAYLALTGREQTRDRLCSLLWPDVDDPRGALRWSLSKLRPLLNDEGRDRLPAGEALVALDLEGAFVDVGLVERAVAEPSSLEALRDAAAAFRGELLEGLDLADAPDFHAFLVGAREDMRRRRVRLLDALVARLENDPDAAVPYALERVQVDREDEDGHVQLLRLLAAAGRTREAEEHFRAHRRWLEGRGARPGPRLLAAHAAVPAAPAERAAARQEIRVCRTRDGVSIAYSTLGTGPTLVKAANWLNHLEFDLETPVWRHWIAELSRGHRLLRYDARGNGLSDRDVPAFTLEDFVSDLDAVVDAAGLDRYALIGMSQGCAVSVLHAIRHPGRVSHLVLLGGFVQGWRARGKPREIEATEAVVTLIERGWGRSNPAFRQVFTSFFFPRASREQMDAFNELQRRSSSPANAARLTRAIGDFDVSEALAHVRVPTLVLHSRGDALIPFEEGRRLAAGIPGARFVPVESDNHLLLEDDPSWPRVQAELRAFLAS